jgi:hypothetical protein
MAPTTPKTTQTPAARTRTPAKKSVPAKKNVPAKKSVPAKKNAAATQKSAVDKTAELSAEVLKAVEAGQRAAIEAVRKFVDTVDEVIPALGDRPSRRETIIDAALDMADKLVTTQYEFLRSVVRSADRSLSTQVTPKQ